MAEADGGAMAIIIKTSEALCTVPYKNLPMPEKIEPTWIAYALESPADADTIVAAIERVERHYARLVNYPTRRHARLGARRGIVVIADAEPRSDWPP
jgi:hypothetical protein